MIRLTRLNGDEFVLNSDRIERIDAHPDTVIMLTDGTRYVVRESVNDVVQEVQYCRATILAWAHNISGGASNAGLLAVPPPASPKEK